MKMRDKLLIFLVFPLLAQFCFSGYGAVEKSKVVEQMTELDALTSIAVATSNLTTQLQRERGLSAGFIGSRGAQFSDALTPQRTATNAKRQAFHDCLASTNPRYVRGDLRRGYDNANALLTQLSDQRAAVTELRISVAEEIQYYTSSIAALLDLIGGLPGRVTDPTLSRDLLVYVSLLQMKESAGVERATLNGAFSADAISQPMLARLYSAVAAQDVHEKIFLSLATPDHAAFLMTTHKGRVVEDSLRMRSIAFSKAREGHFGVLPSVWFDTQTARIELLISIENRLSDELRAAAARLERSARYALVAYVGAASIVLIIGIVLVVVVARGAKALEQRARMLALREQAMQFVLDGMGDGLLVANLDGKLAPERSKIVSQWFGPQATEDDTIWDYLFEDTALHEAARLGFCEIAANVMPFELLAYQMPRSIKRNGLDLELFYKQAFENGEPTRVVVVIRDVTAEIAHEKTDMQNRELQAIIGTLLRDKSGFRSFMDECAQLLDGLPGHLDNVVLFKRDVHTIKGNSSIFGFQSVADYCEELEERMVSDDEHGALGPEIQALVGLWQESLKMIESFLCDDEAANVQILLSEHDKLLGYLRQRRDYGDLIRLVQSWRDEPTRSRLTQLGQQAQQIAQRQGKDLGISVEDNGLRAPRESLSEFWSNVIHVIRNAVDHGLETPDTRVKAGKQRAGKLSLTTTSTAGFFCFSVEDDGCGIDWVSVRAKAESHGLPAETQEDLVEALFCDGFSTKESATEYSGRGVGLSALREACRRKHGLIDVVSASGEGTRFSFRFPTADNPELRGAGPSLAPAR